MNNGQKVQEIMPGCKIAETSVGEAMFGSPSEIVKVLIKKKRSVPSIIVLPNLSLKFGIIQAAIEFPLYHRLFMQQDFFKGKRLKVVGQHQQLERMRTILRQTLLGPSEKEMKAWGISDEEIARHQQIQNHLALKNKNGEVATIDEMVEFISFDNGRAHINGVEIELVDENVFKIIDNGIEMFVDINLAEAQKPPLPIEAPEALARRSILGATALSRCTSGFDPNGYTSGLILWINGLVVSVDGVAWMKEHLRLHGINPREIRAHILTHIHDDHSTILDIIVNGEKAVIITTKTIYESFLVKVANILGFPIEEVRKMTEFVEVVPGKKLNWYGAAFEFFYTVHSIPTVGFRVSVGDKSIVYGGDTIWGSKLYELRNKYVIDDKTHEIVFNIPLLASEITFFDAGGGLIHPLPEELAKLPEQIRKRLILTHRSSLPEELQGKLALVKSGETWEIIPQRVRDVSDVMAVMKSSLLHDGISEDWLSVIISQGEIKEYRTNEIILQEGQAGKNFYLLLGGTVEVLCGDEEVAQLSTGDFFGEISIMKKIPCTATIKAKSPIRVLELPQEIFLELIRSTKLAEGLAQIHQIRPILIEFALFKNLEPQNLNQLIASAQIKEYEAGEIIVRQGERGDAFYGIIDGKVDVVAASNSETKHIATLYRDQCFGEMALLSDGERMATVVAATKVKVFVISKKEFDKIVGEIPSLFYQLGVMAADRRQDLFRKLERN